MTENKNIFFIECPAENFTKSEQIKFSILKINFYTFLRLNSKSKVTIGGLISSTAIIVSTFLTKLTNLNVPNLAFINFGIQLLFYLVLYIVFKQNLFGPKGFRMLLLFRGLTGSISILATYFSIRFICLNEAMSLRYLSSYILIILSNFLLKETLKTLHFLSTFIGIIGSILIVQPATLFQGIGISLSADRLIGRF